MTNNINEAIDNLQLKDNAQQNDINLQESNEGISSDIASDIDNPKPITSRKPEVDSLGRSYATGKRKTSIARVWIRKGSGKFTINSKEISLPNVSAIKRHILSESFLITESLGEFDVMCTVKGGGTSAQTQAIRHGIAGALVRFNPVAYYSSLKSGGLLTRDSRKVERKKCGLRKARKKPQFSKR